MRIRVSVQRNHLFGKTNTQKTVAKVKNLRLEENPSLGLTIWPTDLVTQYTICKFFIDVFLTFPIRPAMCSYIPGEKGERTILFFFSSFFV